MRKKKKGDSDKHSLIIVHKCHPDNNNNKHPTVAVSSKRESNNFCHPPCFFPPHTVNTMV